jgi:hypothetical protein
MTKTKYFILLGLSCLTFSFLLFTDAEKSAFYKALSSTNEEVIVAYKKKLGATLTNYDAKAYYASLVMKEAKFAISPFTKLERFNKGRDMLEACILQNKTNSEYRFLRLMVQENAPSILGYDDAIQQDCQLITANFNQFSATLQTIVLNYSKTSQSLSYSKLKAIYK